MKHSILPALPPNMRSHTALELPKEQFESLRDRVISLSTIDREKKRLKDSKHIIVAKVESNAGVMGIFKDYEITTHSFCAIIEGTFQEVMDSEIDQYKGMSEDKAREDIDKIYNVLDPDVRLALISDVENIIKVLEENGPPLDLVLKFVNSRCPSLHRASKLEITEMAVDSLGSTLYRSMVLLGNEWQDYMRSYTKQLLCSIMSISDHN